jgi:hypothetical protein
MVVQSAGAPSGGASGGGAGTSGALAVGCEVQIHSLLSATEHNGSRGHLIRFDSEKGRWDVSITIGQKGQVLALKPANLSLHATPKKNKAAVEKAAAEKAADDAKVAILTNIRHCFCVL